MFKKLCLEISNSQWLEKHMFENLPLSVGSAMGDPIAPSSANLKITKPFQGFFYKASFVLGARIFYFLGIKSVGCWPACFPVLTLYVSYPACLDSDLMPLTDVFLNFSISCHASLHPSASLYQGHPEPENRSSGRDERPHLLPYRGVMTVHLPLASMSRLKSLSLAMARSGSYTTNRICLSSGYFIKSLAIPSVALDGGVPIRMYFDSISTSPVNNS